MHRGLLAFVDTPTEQTGFSRVGQNLLRRWKSLFRHIDVWGVNYTGWPHNVDYVRDIFPAGMQQTYTTEGMTRFLNQLVKDGEYSHAWILTDTFLLCGWSTDYFRNPPAHNYNQFPNAMRDICAKSGIKTLMYYPVDAPLEPKWTDILRAVDIPVAYTEYGKSETKKAYSKRGDDDVTKLIGKSLDCDSIKVLPHGVDFQQYRPLDNRKQLRQDFIAKGEFGLEFNPDKDFLILNVNSHQRRKNIVGTMQIVADLIKWHKVPAKLILNMHRHDTQTDLRLIGEQLGLEYGKDWVDTTWAFSANRPMKAEDWLNQLYNCADLYLTTTYGEGWGLGITEAMAAGCPVAVPDHTACHEIVQVAGEGLLLPVSNDAIVNIIDNSRVRYPVDTKASADLISHRWHEGFFEKRVQLSPENKRWLSWDRIAAEWGKLF